MWIDDLVNWLSSTSEPLLLVDGGGVLFNNVIEESEFLTSVADEFRVDPLLLRRSYSAAEFEFEANQSDVGEVIARLIGSLGGRKCGAADLNTIDRLYLACVEPSPVMFAVVERVRSSGVRTVLASNEAERWDRVKNLQFGHFELFDVLASSWCVGAVKPSTEYFQRLDSLLAPVSRHRWKLLDDNEQNVLAASQAGMAAMRFCPR